MLSGAPALSRADTYLTAHPGGVQLDANDISYGAGAFVVTLTRPAGAAATTNGCPSGWYCFYDQTYYGYPMGKLRDCGAQSLSAWGWQFRVESAYYNMTRGSVDFYYDGMYLFEVGTGARGNTDVGAYRNLATSVDRVNC